MPRPKVYREYFPSCIERFFGGGKPRRIKARCFVPYTEAEENTEVFLGPSVGAPNIDLDMMVCKEPKKAVTDGYDRTDDGVRCESLPEETCSQRMDCGCKCRCSETSSSTTTSSTTCSTSYSRSTKTRRRPKILVLEDDGRYKEINDEFIGVHRAPDKSRVRVRTPSVKSAKLVLRETKVDVIYPSMPSPQSSTPPASEVFSWDDCPKPEEPKKGVVLGYVMFDPESEDKKLYVTTTDGKRITPAISSGNHS